MSDYERLPANLKPIYAAACDFAGIGLADAASKPRYDMVKTLAALNSALLGIMARSHTCPLYDGHYKCGRNCEVCIRSRALEDLERAKDEPAKAEQGEEA